MTIVDTKMKHGDASDGILGGRLSRIDGPAKITGTADYAMEHFPEGMAHAVIIDSTIASGRILAIDRRGGGGISRRPACPDTGQCPADQDGHGLDWSAAARCSL